MLFKWIFPTGLKSELKTLYISGAISVVPKLEIFGTLKVILKYHFLALI